MSTEVRRNFPTSNAPKVKRATVSWQRQILGPKIAPYLFIAPYFVIFIIFWAFPLIWSLLLSFQHWTAQESTWVGLQNYRFILSNKTIQTAFYNIVWYVFANNAFQIGIALPIAILLDLKFMRRVGGLFRTIFYMPNLVSGIVAGILFSIILGGGGIFVQLFGSLGINVSFLSSVELAKPSVLLAGGWRWIGYWIVIFVAGLQSIPDEYYDVAEIDGATFLERIRYITLPMLRPIIAFVLLINTIGTLQIFEEPFILFRGTGGPLSSATTPVLEMFQLGFVNFNLGGAAALGWLLTIVIMAVSLGQLYITNRGGRNR